MRIIVKGIGAGVQTRQLAALFSRFGKVDDVWITVDRYTGERTGGAIIQMDGEIDAQSAVSALHGLEMAGGHLSVVDDEGGSE